MTPTDMAKIKKIRIGLILMSALLLVGAGFSLFLPAMSPLWIRCVSAVPLLIAAVLWFLPVTKLSIATFLKVLVIANLVLLLAFMQLHNHLEFAKWKTIEALAPPPHAHARRH